MLKIVKKILLTIKPIITAFKDLMIIFLPKKMLCLFFIKHMHFAFLVHPRNIDDVYRKYPFMKKFPLWSLKVITKFLWPIVISHVTGLKNQEGQKINGVIIACSLTPEQMIENKNLAKKKILRCVKLAEKMGVKIIGLGALTASMTNSGLYLADKTDVKITTGRAFTSLTVVNNILKLTKIFEINIKKKLVAIVGATGSIGSMSAKILIKKGFKNLLLIDLERKKGELKKFIKELHAINQKTILSFSFNINDIRKSNLIIAATNTPEHIITSNNLKPGTIIVDDAQPSDVSDDVIKNRDDVMVIEAGIINTPNIDCHFNFGLMNRNDIFSCLAEVLILSTNWEQAKKINWVTNWNTKEIFQMSKAFNFKLSDFQNFCKIFNQKDINKIKKYRKNEF